MWLFKGTLFYLPKETGLSGQVKCICGNVQKSLSAKKTIDVGSERVFNSKTQDNIRSEERLGGKGGTCRGLLGSDAPS